MWVVFGLLQVFGCITHMPCLTTFNLHGLARFFLMDMARNWGIRLFSTNTIVHRYLVAGFTYTTIIIIPYIHNSWLVSAYKVRPPGL